MVWNLTLKLLLELILVCHALIDLEENANRLLIILQRMLHI